jgi:hypothetical protein
LINCSEFSRLPDSLYDEEKIDLVNPEGFDRDIGNDGNNLSLQTVEKTLKLTLICGHLEIEPVNFVVHSNFLSKTLFKI